MSSVTYTFSQSTTAASAQVNQNFTDCITAINQNTPSGLIAMWSGAIAAIPTGWVLCNGSNSTPDLRDNFIVGAGNGYNPGDTGGEAAHTLTIPEMPTHNHRLVTGSGTTSSGYLADTNNGSAGPYTMDTGGGGSHENRPPFYALAYIMKT